MRSNDFELKRQEKLVIGCGSLCKESMYLEGVRLGKVDHMEIHPPTEFLTMDLPGSSYRPDIEGDLTDAKLKEIFPKGRFSQIIIEHLPPAAINKQAITNLSYLLTEQGVCLGILSRYLGRSIAHVGMDFHTGLLNKICSGLKLPTIAYEKDNYEFFHNLQSSGFQTILFLDDAGLNFVLFKVDVIKAQEVFASLIKRNDYFSNICQRKALLEAGKSNLIWGAIDNIVLKSKLFIINMIENSSEQTKEIIKSFNRHIVRDGDSVRDECIVDTIGFLGSKNALSPALLKAFFNDYNTLFQYLFLAKKHLDSLINVLEQINQERESFSYSLFSVVKASENNITDLEHRFVTNLINQLLYFSPTIHEGVLNAMLDIKEKKEDVCELIYVKFRKDIKNCLLSLLGTEANLQALLHEMLTSNPVCI